MRTSDTFRREEAVAILRKALENLEGSSEPFSITYSWEYFSDLRGTVESRLDLRWVEVKV